jgi:hypothetical protein
MREYTHTSRICRFDELNPEIATALREFASKHPPLMAEIEAQQLGCVETTSHLVKISFLERMSGLGEKTFTTGILLTQGFVIWSTCGPRRKTTAAAARLADTEITQIFYDRTADTGLDVFCLMVDRTERNPVYIALGGDAAGEEFKRIFRAALEKAYS